MNAPDDPEHEDGESVLETADNIVDGPGDYQGVVQVLIEAQRTADGAAKGADRTTALKRLREAATKLAGESDVLHQLIEDRFEEFLENE